MIIILIIAVVLYTLPLVLLELGALITANFSSTDNLLIANSIYFLNFFSAENTSYIITSIIAPIFTIYALPSKSSQNRLPRLNIIIGVLLLVNIIFSIHSQSLIKNYEVNLLREGYLTNNEETKQLINSLTDYIKKSGEYLALVMGLTIKK